MAKEHVNADESSKRVEAAANDLVAVAHRRIQKQSWGRLTVELRFEEGLVKSYRVLEETTVGPQRD